MKIIFSNGRFVELDEDEFIIESVGRLNIIAMNLPSQFSTKDVKSAIHQECKYFNVLRFNESTVVFKDKVCNI